MRANSLIRQVVVPNFEKSCQNMYQQVNSSFIKGTQDYLVEFQQLASQAGKRLDEGREPVLAQLTRVSEQMSSQSAQALAGDLQQQFEANLR